MKQSAAILLAGGLSTRMGSSKADLIIEGKTQTQRMLEILDPLVDQTIIMLAGDQKIPDFDEKLNKKVTIGRDSIKEKGPLQAISDAVPLISGSTDSIYLLTCDLPYLNREWLIELSNNLTGEIMGVCAVTDGYKNALLGCYKKKVLARIEYQLKAGKKNAMSIWEGFNISFMEPSRMQRILCKDMNTPAEYNKAKDFFKDHIEGRP